MNNHGSISLKNSSEINRKFKYPVSATANSTIQIRDGNLNLQNNVILTEVTASNASVAAARATAKAASIATSTITNDKNYLTNGDPLEKSVTFQISTMCTIQRTKSDDVGNNSRVYNSKIQTDTVKSLNQKLYSNSEIENIHVPVKSHKNKGTKFERLRRELESLEQDRIISYDNDINVGKTKDFKSNKFSDNSIHSNISTLSSCQSDQPFYYSALSEPLHYLSDSSNATSADIKVGKSSFQRNSFLSTDNESSDNGSSLRKFKISDLKKHNKTFNSYSSDMHAGNLKNMRDVSNVDVNSLHCVKTMPGVSYIKSLTMNEDVGSLLSSSLLPETDIDSGTLSENYFFPQTHFSGDQSPYSFEKTRSLIDLRKNNDTDYNTNIHKAISTEDFKKPKNVEECDLIKRLKSRAQSTQELRVADSLTKLNVPEWMNDFKLSSTPRREITPRISASGAMTISFKNLKHHDSILSKHKYTSLPLNKQTVPNRTEPKQVLLPSSLYRSRSQNLIYFNPKEDSKLRNIKDENIEPITSSLRILNEKYSKNNFPPRSIIEKPFIDKPIIEKPIIDKWNFEKSIIEKPIIEKRIFEKPIIEKSIIEKPINDKRIFEKPITEKPNMEKPIPGNLEIKAISNKTETIPKNLSTVSHKEINLFKFAESEEVIRQDKNESESVLKILINSTQSQSSYDMKLCECFGINPSALKLLLNVKRKTPNLNRDETYISFKKKENIFIENTIMNSENKNNYVICNLKGCGKEILQTNKVDRGNCSCYNCYTYYCSKKCRNYDFAFHLTVCSFKRINKMLTKLKDSFSEIQLQQLSIFAKENYHKYGEGTVLIAFESCRAADDFLNGQLNRLLSQPYYLSQREIKKLIPSFKIIEYDSTKEVVITLIISATLPMTSIELSYPTFKYSFKLEYIDKKVSEENFNTKGKDMFKDYEIRKRFFYYVINFFKAKNVILNLSHSMIYNKLERYLNEDLHFEPQKIFIKDPVTNYTVAYVVSPNKEIISTIIRNVSKRSIADENPISDTNTNANKTITETEI